ncbi:hypothetical protein V1Y59_14555 [Gordonia sp. PKS22-38]|uniref:EcsC protein family protein n=1 Tax=Gordonia prachuapensis TaxID=3115651 RepID=A0ABU7MWX3_9ACTN|nr:hypothetical protein [Gordonia sp. PKS22-38]
MADVSDSHVAAVLERAVAGINPVLDALAERDPLGLKKHTFHDDPHPDSKVQQALHVLAQGVDATDWPGTQGWTKRSMNSRADWWISRIGTVNTVAVAYPGVFGGWTRRLPLASVLGFANQAIVLVAIAREYGVTDRSAQVRLLASVLCGRDIDRSTITDDSDPAESGPLPTDGDGKTLIGAIWDVAKILRGLTNEFERRPQPILPLRMLAYIPVVGAPVTYVGERLALSQAARHGRQWIAEHPDAVSPRRA